jgi:hypothetical protein
MAGMKNDGVRDTPDVALMAANGLWGHYYVICYSDTTTDGKEQGGTPCTGQPINWPGYGGTSVSSPIMAAIQALVVQHKGALQGLPNVRYYALANTEYGATGSAACNSSLGNGVGSSCIFYDVTLGRQHRELPGAQRRHQVQLLPAFRLDRCAFDEQRRLSAGLQNRDRVGLQLRHRQRERIQPGDELLEAAPVRFVRQGPLGDCGPCCV